MKLIDTSILVPVFRDKTGSARERFRRFMRGGDFALTRFTQLELLWGCRSELQWEALSSYLDDQFYLDARHDTWGSAARIFFDLQKAGLTVRSIIDCCIAQIAIERRFTLIHNDKDFETIARIRPLRVSRFDIQARD